MPSAARRRPEYPDPYDESAGRHGMNQYETIGIVRGIVISGIILLAGVVVGRREHA